MSQAVLYGPGREGFLKGEISWNVATIKVDLGRGYTFDSTDKFVSDLTSHTAVSTYILSGKTVTDGVADASDFSFPAVGAGTACTYMVIYQASAVTGGADVATSAQRVIAYIDNSTGLPVTPNGADIAVTFDSGANRIFKL